MKKIYKQMAGNTAKENFRLLRILFDIVYVKLLVSITPLSFYAHWFRSREDITPEDMQPFQKEISLIYRIMELVPWKLTCLMEVMTFHKYFRRYKLYIPIFVGVNTGEQMKAHAWMFSEEHQGFSTIEV